MKPEQKELLKEIYEKNATRSGLTMPKSELREKLETVFPKLFKAEKYIPKVGEWVFFDGKYATNGMLKFQGYGKVTYGLNSSNIWADGFTPAEYYTFYPATPSEIESRLRKYASEVLGINDDTHIEFQANGINSVDTNSGRYQMNYHYPEDILYNSNGCIYSNGKWAKPKPSIPSDISELVSKYGGKEELIKILNN